MEPERKDVVVSELKSWGAHLSEVHLPRYPDRQVMAEFLSLCGANLEAVKGHEESMQGWTDKRMAEAMGKIWGKRWEEIKDWNKEFIKEYEERTGRTLPSIPIYKKGTKEEVGRSKQSSMKHFLGLMTRWAAFKSDEDLEFNEKRFVDEVLVRIINGFSRQEGVTNIEELASIDRPDTGEIYHPSLPPEYASALISKLTSWVK